MRSGRDLIHRALLLLALAGTASVAEAQEDERLPPYLMMRSLEYVQDLVVQGDHSASEMQRFVLSRLDKRLRNATADTFEDPRNVDAALLYAMSGGNPATLDYLVARDINGHFDNRVTDVLRKYLAGKGVLMMGSIADLLPVYKNSRLAPYLALVAGNVTIAKDPAKALNYYDWARLTAPGTIVEEAALRRSLSIALDTGKIEPALGYANRYARRFLYSPYASQFVDLFVQLVVDHDDKLDQTAVLETVAAMDSARQKEVYLRIARKAAIGGKVALAAQAADRANQLSGLPGGGDPQALLYGGVARLPTEDVQNALNSMASLPEDQLNQSDRALLNAARAIAQEIVRLPTAPPVAANEAPPPTMAVTPSDSLQQQDPAGKAVSAPVQPVAPASQQAAEAMPQKTDPSDAAFSGFVSDGRAKLEAIDKLLKGEGVN
ncbi:chemotaxis protein MotC [Rhizobium paknamense]|uniref:Chemotaxis protein MotC n=1 Tax=Rhizobium paknamense TaxID=1206817 RepID=A0ABU0IIG6_9HYPH|nr:chemotaxis protein MotC [Rhizobium paknamense]MDQ0456999.1 chemotaxis protein MotC [Rhizobium paknamense]